MIEQTRTRGPNNRFLDQEYANIIKRSNPSMYGLYIDSYNEYLRSLPSSTNDFLEAKANGEETFMIVDREFPVSQGEGSEEETIEAVEDTELSELQAKYTEVTGKNLSPAYKNNKEWILAKIEEAK